MWVSQTSLKSQRLDFLLLNVSDQSKWRRMMIDARDSTMTQWKRDFCHSKLTLLPLLFFSAARRWEACLVDLTNWQNKAELLSVLMNRRPHLNFHCCANLLPCFLSFPLSSNVPLPTPLLASHSFLLLIALNVTNFTCISSRAWLHQSVPIRLIQHRVT